MSLATGPKLKKLGLEPSAYMGWQELQVEATPLCPSAGTQNTLVETLANFYLHKFWNCTLLIIFLAYDDWFIKYTIFHSVRFDNVKYIRNIKDFPNTILFFIKYRLWQPENYLC